MDGNTQPCCAWTLVHHHTALQACRLWQSVCVCAGRLARVGSKSKEEMAKSLAQSSAPGTIPAKGPGGHLIPNTINIYILISIDIHIYLHHISINIISYNDINSSTSLDISIKPSAATASGHQHLLCAFANRSLRRIAPED